MPREKCLFLGRVLLAASAEDLILTTLATSGKVIAPKSVYEPLSLEEVERRHILHTLNATGWNKSRTSAILGIERSTLDRKIQRYKMVQNHPQADV